MTSSPRDEREKFYCNFNCVIALNRIPAVVEFVQIITFIVLTVCVLCFQIQPTPTDRENVVVMAVRVLSGGLCKGKPDEPFAYEHLRIRCRRRVKIRYLVIFSAPKA